MLHAFGVITRPRWQLSVMHVYEGMYYSHHPDLVQTVCVCRHMPVSEIKCVYVEGNEELLADRFCP